MDNRLQFFTEWYHKENERQQSLNESISIPTGIVSAISVAYYFLISEFRFESKIDNFIEYLFIGLIFTSIITWSYTVYNLFRAYNDLFKGFTYKAINFPTVLNTYYDQLKDYSDDYNKLYEEYLLKVISESLEQNIINNDSKSGYLHLSKRYLLITLVPLLISLGPFVYNFFNTEKEPYNISIVNHQPNKIKIMAKQTTKPTTPPAQPGIRLVKEGSQKPSPKGGNK
ncbi:hypothetical protein FA048_06490 [Pedobacter polaris]|uniref:SMODS and SLOG-associating 2TM effector domain-containing protein n=1 Tax=Pedobacter polaris TaxID=2571273 RepID=A0A4U1CP84_9SPHI|nr:hypothetical protein [Pedobacter polaris]TKC09857.1 hypothetical protein FA048_06490 [Pedobacter polaris]